MKVLISTFFLLWSATASALTQSYFHIATELIKERDCNQSFLDKSAKLLTDDKAAGYPKLSKLLLNGCQFATYPAGICERREEIQQSEYIVDEADDISTTQYAQQLLGKGMTKDKIDSLMQDEEISSKDCEDKIALLTTFKAKDEMMATIESIFKNNGNDFEIDKQACERKIKELDAKRNALVQDKIALCAKARGTSPESIQATLCTKYPWVCKGMKSTTSNKTSKTKSNSTQNKTKSLNSPSGTGGVMAE